MGIKVGTSVIYKISYPNGKIYVGKDMTNNINYFGSANPISIERDFDEMQRNSFTITRDILWTSKNATLQEVNRKEIEFIRALRSNDSAIGYNRWPVHSKQKSEH